MVGEQLTSYELPLKSADYWPSLEAVNEIHAYAQTHFLPKVTRTSKNLIINCSANRSATSIATRRKLTVIDWDNQRSDRLVSPLRPPM